MKTLKTALIALVLISLCAVASADLYPETARVVDLDYAEDIVTVETFNGHLFAFEGCEDYALNDCVSLIMDDRGTELIYDDAIVKAEYGGWELVNWYAGE